MKLPVPGDVLLEKYRIEVVLGEGGFGRVYQATTLNTGRPVAIKVLKVGESLNATSRVGRFLREMRAIAKLESPHTITLFDYGRTENGAPFMVCEYIDGEDLHELLARQGRLNPDDALHVLKQVLLSLSEAHRLGLLHRDLKPSNIRIFEYGKDPLRAKLLDFGLAKSLRDDEARLTGTGNVIGTPRYMSPEQLLGHELTPASDLFSVGLVMLEMLVGTEEFRAQQPMGERRVPADVRLEPTKARVVDRLLERDIQRRWGTADEVLAALSETNGPPRSAASPRTPRPKPTPPSAPVRAEVPRVAWIAVLTTGLTVAVLMWVIWSDDVRPVAKVHSPTPAPAALTQRVPAEPPPLTPDVRLADIETTDLSAGCGARDLAGADGLRVIDGLSARVLAAYVPRSYDASIPHALIVMLHESAANPGVFIEESGFPALAETNQLVIVAPSGGNPFAWEEGSYDIIERAIDDALGELCIDTRRIYAVGHSSGGKAVEGAGCALPRIRAIATTSRRGRVGSELACPNSPVPALHIVGRDDGYNPLPGGTSCSGSEKISLAEKERRWIARNQCGADSTVWLTHGGSTCRTWECVQPLVSCVLDGGRGWNGTGDRLWDTKNCDGEPADFPYAATMWRFFQSLDL